MTEVSSDQAIPRGDIMRELADVNRRVQRMETARRLESARIGRGGLRVRGGQVGIENDEGDETLTLASNRLSLTGQLDVTGDVMSRDPSGNRRARLLEGQLWLASGVPGESSGQMFAGEIEGRITLQILPPRLQGDSATNRIIIDGDSPTLPGGGLFFVTGGDAVFEAAGDVFLVPDSGNLVVQVRNTTASANVWVDGSDASAPALLLRITSRADSKVDAEDLDVDPAEVLTLQPRTWRDRGEVERDPDTDRWHVGLIAEEVEAAGLAEFVDYDEQGNPASVTYDRLVVALLAVVKDQQRRLDALDGGAPPAVERTRKPPRRPMSPPQRRSDAA